MLARRLSTKKADGDNGIDVFRLTPQNGSFEYHQHPV
jgi:hypothetical protein